MADTDLPNKWCLSCNKQFSTRRETCPDCLAELVADPSAHLICPNCGNECAQTVECCPKCLTLIHVEDDQHATDDALVAMLASGVRMLRPAKEPLFRDGCATTLTRFTPNGGLIIAGRDSLVEAYVDSEGDKALPPLFCRDVTGAKLFRLGVYEASAHSLVVFDATDAPQGIYQRHPDPLDRSMLVRDETSAPVATMRPSMSVRFDFELVETGGGIIAGIDSNDDATDDWVDDRWTLRPLGPSLPLKLYGAIGILLAAKVFFWAIQTSVDSPARSRKSRCVGRLITEQFQSTDT